MEGCLAEPSYRFFGVEVPHATLPDFTSGRLDTWTLAHAAIANHPRISARGTTPIRSAMIIFPRKSTEIGNRLNPKLSGDSRVFLGLLTSRTKPRPAIFTGERFNQPDD
jgi:hypothetical protein